MADPNQYNVGETIIWGNTFYRNTETSPQTEVVIDQTTCSLVVTDPLGATSTINIGSMRHVNGSGRYEADYDTTSKSPGRYQGVWTGTATYTDELGNSRSYKMIETHYVDVVSP